MLSSKDFNNSLVCSKLSSFLAFSSSAFCLFASHLAAFTWESVHVENMTWLGWLNLSKCIYIVLFIINVFRCLVCTQRNRFQQRTCKVVNCLHLEPGEEKWRSSFISHRVKYAVAWVLKLGHNSGLRTWLKTSMQITFGMNISVSLGKHFRLSASQMNNHKKLLITNSLKLPCFGGLKCIWPKKKSPSRICLFTRLLKKE